MKLKIFDFNLFKSQSYLALSQSYQLRVDLGILSLCYCPLYQIPTVDTLLQDSLFNNIALNESLLSFY